MKLRDTNENFKFEDGKFVCLSCGYVEELQLPYPIEEWTKLLKKLAKQHRNCKKVEK